MSATKTFLSAADTTDIETFLARAFPPEWKGVAARILETGVTMSGEPCNWAPRWSPIPPTVRTDKAGNEDITRLKSIIFRVHDCLHQLWGLPHPGTDFTKDDFYYYKRAQMCGEVAVLTITEFVFCKWVYDTYPTLQYHLWSRQALPMLETHLKGKSLLQIVMRMDDLLHKKSRPRWVREDPIASAFCDDYVQMLQTDRDMIDICWEVMKENPEFVRSLYQMPKARFGRDLDGLELTIWMVEDFEHLLSSATVPDYGLIAFNRERRSKIQFPEGWPV